MCRNAAYLSFAVLMALPHYSFSCRIVRYVQKNKIQRVKRMLKKQNEYANRFFVFGTQTGDVKVTLLYLASEKRFVDMVKLLLDYGADPNLYWRYSQEPFQVYRFPLLSAVMSYSQDKRSNDRQIVNLLLEHGADVNKKNRYGCSPTGVAICYMYAQTFHMLLRYGANPFENRKKGFPVGVGNAAEQIIMLFHRALLQDFDLSYLMNQSIERVSVNTLEEFVTSEDMPLFIKIKALLFLLKHRRELSQKIRDADVKKYFSRIPFLYAFFSNDALFGFAVENEYLQVVDCRGKTVSESMHICMTPEIIPTVLSRCAVLYEDKDIVTLMGEKKVPKRRKKKRHKKLLEFEPRKQFSKPIGRALVEMVHRAKQVGRRDFVKKFYRAYVLSRTLCAPSVDEQEGFLPDCEQRKKKKKFLPPEIAGRIVGYI